MIFIANSLETSKLLPILLDYEKSLNIISTPLMRVLIRD